MTSFFSLLIITVLVRSELSSACRDPPAAVSTVAPPGAGTRRRSQYVRMNARFRS